MSLLGGIAALAALCALVRVGRRSPLLAMMITAVVVSCGVPAVHAVTTTVSRAQDDIHRWQQDRIAVGACAVNPDSSNCGTR
jgi:hypothetical protein